MAKEFNEYTLVQTMHRRASNQIRLYVWILPVAAVVLQTIISGAFGWWMISLSTHVNVIGVLTFILGAISALFAFLSVLEAPHFRFKWSELFDNPIRIPVKEDKLLGLAGYYLSEERVAALQDCAARGNLTYIVLFNRTADWIKQMDRSGKYFRPDPRIASRAQRQLELLRKPQPNKEPE